MRIAVNCLLLSAMALVGIGLSTVASTTMWKGPNFVVKQAVWIVIAAVACVVASRLPLAWLQKWAWGVYAAAVGLLVLVLVPGVGLEIAGSRRWLDLGPVNYQPSEFAKVAVLILMAALICRPRRTKLLLLGFLLPISCVLVVASLIVVEPDYGTAVLIVFISGGMLFLSGSRLSYLSGAALLGIAALAVLVFIRPNSMNRIEAWLNPDNSNPAAFQLEQSHIAIGRGGLRGQGFLQSQQKELHLPEAHTDFILAIWAEEQGFMGSMIVIALYLVFFACGFTISCGSRDEFMRLLGLGVTFLITYQALINMSVVTGLFPTKGIALPFQSYGGSHLLTTGVMIGLLVGIARQADPAGDGGSGSRRGESPENWSTA